LELKREFTISHFATCARCGGTGAEPGTKSTSGFSCRGTGTVQQFGRRFWGPFTHASVCPECGGEGYRPEKPVQ